MERHEFGKFVSRTRPRVIRVVDRVCGDPDTAQDIAQEAFIRTWHNLDRIRDESAGYAYVTKCAMNLARNERRNMRRRQGLLTRHPLQRLTRTTPIDEVALMELKERLHAFKAELSPRRQQIFNECFIKGSSNQEVADRLGVSVRRIANERSVLKAGLQGHLGLSMQASDHEHTTRR